MSVLTKFVEKGIISETQMTEIENTMEREGKSVDQILVEDFGISDERVFEIKKEYYQYTPVLDIDDVNDVVLKYIPFDNARKYFTVPLRVSEDGYLDVGMLDPENFAAKSMLQFLSSALDHPYRINLISYTTYKKILKKYGSAKLEVSRALNQFGIKKEDIEEKKTEEALIKDDGPIAKIVSNIIKYAARERASDIHIEAHEKEIVVRYRIDGVLVSNLKLPIDIHPSIVARIKVMSKLKIDEKRKPQDGRFSGEFEGRKIDFRVSSFPTFYGEKIVMRLLEQDRGALPLTDIGLNEENLNTVNEIIKHSYGIILVCGPTGSGKTNTLYSILNEIDKETKNVVSLENPIELNVPGVSQSQVHPQIGYTFASGLRSILRQDPDIIMVGEIRDKETAELAIEAALTGHLVLSTIHTNTASDVPQRLVNMGVEPYLIGPTLIAAIGQRLVRKIRPEFKKEVPISEEAKEFINKSIADLPQEYQERFRGDKMYIVDGEDKKAGMKGRTAVFEILKVNKAIQEIILKDPSSLKIYDTARKDGFITFREDGILKALKGVTTFDEVMKL